MSPLPRPWRTIEAEIEAEMAAKLLELRRTSDPHDYRHIQGEIDGLERALEIARRQPGEPITADDVPY